MNLFIPFALQLYSIHFSFLLVLCASAAFQEVNVQELEVSAEAFLLDTAPQGKS